MARARAVSPDWGCRPLTILISETAKGQAVHISGELDAGTAPRLGDWLEAESWRYAIGLVDLSELTFVDLAGVRTLATTVAALDARKAVSVVGMRGIVRRVVRLLALDDQLRPIDGLDIRGPGGPLARASAPIDDVLAEPHADRVPDGAAAEPAGA